MGVSTVVPENDNEMMEELKGLPANQLAHIAEVAKHDLFVMSRGVLGYQDVNRQTHGALCVFLQNDEPEVKRRMDLMPRMHLKTTIATIANPIRRAVKMPKLLRQLLVGETDTTAVNFLREIKQHWETENTALRLLYPDLVPPKFHGPGSDWSMTRASINGKGIFKEATWNAIGVGGAVVGGHFNFIDCDDIIGFAAMESPALMETAKKWVDNIDPLLTNAIMDLITFTGTRWSRQDVYSHIMKLYGEGILIFRREAIENGLPIFPQKHSLVSLGQIQKVPRVWFAQYCNNPLASGQTDFPQGALRTYTFTNERKVTGWRDGRRVEWGLGELDIVMAVDPNGGSKTAADDAAITVSGMAPDEDVFVLETYNGKPSPSELVDKTYELWEKWRPRVVGIEQAGQQSTKHYFDKKAKETGNYIYTIPLKPRNRDKIGRIRNAMEPILSSRRLWCLASQTELRSQIEFFPDLELFDIIDALSYGTEEGMWRAPYTVEEQEENNRAIKLISARRNSRTGY